MAAKVPAAEDPHDSAAAVPATPGSGKSLAPPDPLADWSISSAGGGACSLACEAPSSWQGNPASPSAGASTAWLQPQDDADDAALLACPGTLAFLARWMNYLCQEYPMWVPMNRRNFFANLRDGLALGRVVERLAPGSDFTHGFFYRPGVLENLCMKNLDKALIYVWRHGVKATNMCPAVHFYRSHRPDTDNDKRAVVRCIVEVFMSLQMRHRDTRSRSKRVLRDMQGPLTHMGRPLSEDAINGDPSALVAEFAGCTRIMALLIASGKVPPTDVPRLREESCCLQNEEYFIQNGRVLNDLLRSLDCPVMMAPCEWRRPPAPFPDTLLFQLFVIWEFCTNGQNFHVVKNRPMNLPRETVVQQFCAFIDERFDNPTDAFHWVSNTATDLLSRRTFLQAIERLGYGGDGKFVWDLMRHGTHCGFASLVDWLRFWKIRDIDPQQTAEKLFGRCLVAKSVSTTLKGSSQQGDPNAGNSRDLLWNSAENSMMHSLDAAVMDSHISFCPDGEGVLHDGQAPGAFPLEGTQRSCSPQGAGSDPKPMSCGLQLPALDVHAQLGDGSWQHATLRARAVQDGAPGEGDAGAALVLEMWLRRGPHAKATLAAFVDVGGVMAVETVSQGHPGMCPHGPTRFVVALAPGADKLRWDPGARLEHPEVVGELPPVQTSPSALHPGRDGSLLLMFSAGHCKAARDNAAHFFDELRILVHLVQGMVGQEMGAGSPLLEAQECWRQQTTSLAGSGQFSASEPLAVPEPVARGATLLP